ncbi:MAG: hypothetical protein Tsb002_31200 [Wenzhouxiangellaceae bacterium]
MDKPVSSMSLLDALAASAVRLFRPLVRILLRNGVSFRTCADWLRWCYVDVAQREFSLPGRKQSKSRVAVLTGLTRVDVDRLLSTTPPHKSEQDEQYHRAARVLSAWRYEKGYCDEAGEPLVLAFDADNGPSFTDLVNRHSGGTPPRAVLDELERIGCVEILSGRRIRLVREQFVTADDEQHLVNVSILGMSTGRLLDTIDNNLHQGEAERRLQLMVLHPRIPQHRLPEIKTYLESRSREFVRDIDAWLYEQVGDEEVSAQAAHQLHGRAGLGLYFFQEIQDQSPQSADNLERDLQQQ